MFYVGHTSTSVSLATGLAKGRDVVGKDGNVIAIIGDGSLSGGKADVKVLNYGFENKFYDGVEASVALKERRITPEDICEDIK